MLLLAHHDRYSDEINAIYKREEDPLKEIMDPKYYSMALLANLSSQFRGRFPPIITKYLSEANQASLLQLCNSYNLATV